jgi:transposase
MLLDQIDTLSAQIDQLTIRAEQLLAAMPAAQAPGQHDQDGGQPPGATGSSPAAGIVSPAGAAEDTRADGGLTAWQRLDEITGIGPLSAQVIIAEIGLDMGCFATPGHLVSWSKLSPRTIQSGTKQRGGATGKGNPYLKGGSR